VTQSNDRVLVIIPTYNERENIERAVTGVHTAAPHVDVLIADDSSPDGTGLIADTLARDNDWLHVLHRPGKEGLGAAYIDGFGWGLRNGYDVLVEMDADGSHRPQDLPLLLNALRDRPDIDVVLGSRWVPGGRVVNWPFKRQLLSRAGNAYTRLMLGMPVADATGGFRAFRAPVLRALDLSKVRSQGYCFQVDMVRRASQRGFRVAEVPITFVERVHGTSKMSGGIVREALTLVTVWGVTDRLRRLVTGRSKLRRSVVSDPGPESGLASPSPR
jgi:dolichol-phosphate mannosyltransferase